MKKLELIHELAMMLANRSIQQSPLPIGKTITVDIGSFESQARDVVDWLERAGVLVLPNDSGAVVNNDSESLRDYIRRVVREELDRRWPEIEREVIGSEIRSPRGIQNVSGIQGDSNE